jgi:hypothetical protein
VIYSYSLALKTLISAKTGEHGELGFKTALKPIKTRFSETASEVFFQLF